MANTAAPCCDPHLGKGCSYSEHGIRILRQEAFLVACEFAGRASIGRPKTTRRFTTSVVIHSSSRSLPASTHCQGRLMPNSLLTGVSGLLAHQRMLDVVGHNIANMNTTAFKSQRILFADLLYETIQPASGAGENQGGTNPNQIGGGVKAALTDRDFSQGALENTGGQFDFALDGPGFFTLTTDAGDRFTRAGTFTLDEQGFLVAPGGLHLKRFTNAGEPDGVNPGFQVPGDPRIQIPLGASIEGVVTEQVEVTGNLNAQQSPPTAQSLRSLRPFTVSGTNAVASDLLNSSDSVSTPYVTGDQIVIEGVRGDGSGQIFTTVDVGPSSTFQDLSLIHI